MIFDGLSNSELRHLLDTDDPAIANLRRILDRSALFRFGSTVNFPSITWPSHSTIFTGAWCGHHDIVNPTYYARESRTAARAAGPGMMTESYLGHGVETLYEAFHRVLGADAFTANIHEPQGRGADHAALERRVVGPRDRLKALTPQFVEAISPRYAADGKEAVHREAVLDARGMAQVMVLFDDPSHPPPVLVAHEFALTDGAGHDYGPHSDGLRTAIAETDRRLGQVLDMLRSEGPARLDAVRLHQRPRHGGAGRGVARQPGAPSGAHRHQDGHRRADDLAARSRRHGRARARRPHRARHGARQRCRPVGERRRSPAPRFSCRRIPTRPLAGARRTWACSREADHQRDGDRRLRDPGGCRAGAHRLVGAPPRLQPAPPPARRQQPGVDLRRALYGPASLKSARRCRSSRTPQLPPYWSSTWVIKWSKRRCCAD